MSGELVRLLTGVLTIAALLVCAAREFVALRWGEEAVPQALRHAAVGLAVAFLLAAAVRFSEAL